MKPKPLVMALIVCVLLGLMIAPFVSAQDNETYTVRNGDTLWDISKKFYEDPYLWPALWALNQDRMANPHQLTVGDVLVIYQKEELEKVEVKEEEVEVEVPVEEPEPLYEPSRPIETIFPRYFTYMANPAGWSDTGINRIRVKKVIYETRWEVDATNQVRQVTEKKVFNTYEDVFEVGDIVIPDNRTATRTLQIPSVSGIVTDTSVNLTELMTDLGFVLRNMELDGRFEFKIRDDPTFIDGRCGDVFVDNIPTGVFGEISPQVLGKFEVGRPIVAFELLLPSNGDWQ